MQNVNSGKHSAYSKLFNEIHMYILLSYQHTQPISPSFGRVPELHLPRCPSLIFSLSLDFRNTLSGNKSWLELNPSRRLPPVFIPHTSVITAPGSRSRTPYYCHIVSHLHWTTKRVGVKEFNLFFARIRQSNIIIYCTINYFMRTNK